MEACVCTIDRDNGPDMDEDTGDILYYVAIFTATSDLMCCECGQTIPAGTVLEITRGRYEDDWHEYHTCIGCQRMRDDIMRCGFTHGEVLQDIFDAWCEQLDGDMDEDEQEATEDEIWEALT